VQLKAHTSKAARAPQVVLAGAADSFREGGHVASDNATVLWKQVPDDLRGRARLATASTDVGQAQGVVKYTVNVSGPCTIYLPVPDKGGVKKPGWLDAAAWQSSGLRAEATSGTTYTLWKKAVAAAGDVTLSGNSDKPGFTLCYVFAGPGERKWEHLTSPWQDKTSFDDQNLRPGQRVFYRMRATGAAGKSAWSAEVEAAPAPGK
jgi:hypothetical protein